MGSRFFWIRVTRCVLTHVHDGFVRKNKWVTISATLLLASLFYVGLTLWSGADEFLSALQNFPPGYGTLVGGAVTAGYLIRYIRWDYYLKRLGHRVPAGPNLRIFLASFLMAISPGKVGEAMKSYFLKKEFRIPATPTIAGFFCERFTDVGAMILLSASGFFLYPRGGWAMGLILIMMILILLLLQKPRWMERFLLIPLSRSRWFSPLVEKIRVFYQTSGNLLSPVPLGLGLVMGMISWGLEGLCLYWILLGLGIETILPITAVLIFSASVLLGAASMLPGGIGSGSAPENSDF